MVVPSTISGFCFYQRKTHEDLLLALLPSPLTTLFIFVLNNQTLAKLPSQTEFHIQWLQVAVWNFVIEKTVYTAVHKGPEKLHVQNVVLQVTMNTRHHKHCSCGVESVHGWLSSVHDLMAYQCMNCRAKGLGCLLGQTAWMTLQPTSFG